MADDQQQQKPPAEQKPPAGGEQKPPITPPNPGSNKPGEKESKAAGKYRLKEDAGTHWVVDKESGERRRLEAGEEVELTAAQFEAIGDKFTKV